MKIISFTQLKKTILKDPETKKAYDDLQFEFDIISLLIRKRIELGFTQKELAKKIGTRQSAISRLESGEYNPSLLFLYKVAHGLGAKLGFSLN